MPEELARRDPRAAPRAAGRIGAPRAYRLARRLARGRGLDARALLTSTDDDTSAQSPAPKREDRVAWWSLALDLALPDSCAVGIHTHVGPVEGARTP
jgi:hypothetical protein